MEKQDLHKNYVEIDVDRIQQEPYERTVSEKIAPFLRLITPIVGVLIMLANHFLEIDFPYTTVEIVEGIGAVITMVGIVWSWWKNNDVTDSAVRRRKAADEVLEKIERDGI